METDVWNKEKKEEYDGILDEQRKNNRFILVAIHLNLTLNKQTTKRRLKEQKKTAWQNDDTNTLST